MTTPPSVVWLPSTSDVTKPSSERARRISSTPPRVRRQRIPSNAARRAEEGSTRLAHRFPAWPRDAGAQALGVGVLGMVEYPGGGTAFDHGPAVQDGVFVGELAHDGQAAQASISFFMAGLPEGTQWSHRPRLSLPAAPAVRICTSGSAAAAAPTFSARRREILVVMTFSAPLRGRSAAAPFFWFNNTATRVSRRRRHGNIAPIGALKQYVARQRCNPASGGCRRRASGGYRTMVAGLVEMKIDMQLIVTLSSQSLLLVGRGQRAGERYGGGGPTIGREVQQVKQGSSTQISRISQI